MKQPDSNNHRKKLRRGYFVIVLIAVLPVISALLASFLGWCLGCNVNEAGISDCIRFGINLGEMLSTMFIMGWTTLLSIPLAIILLIVWSIYMNKKLKKA